MSKPDTLTAVSSNDGLGLEPQRKKLDEFDWHEALDMASLFERLLDTELLQLAAVQSDDDVRQKIESAVAELAEVVQLIGRRRFYAGMAETIGKA